MKILSEALIEVKVDLKGGDTVVGCIDTGGKDIEEFIKNNTSGYLEIETDEGIVSILQKYIMFLRYPKNIEEGESDES